MKRISKEKAFNLLWAKYDYCMMGYDYYILKKSMSKEEVVRRLEAEENKGWD